MHAALVDYLKHNNPLAQHAPGGASRGTGAVSTASSYNWSGYVDSSPTTGDFTQVNGGWKVPKVTCTPEDQLVINWVGMDGWSDGNVEQAGTMEWCFKGTASYYTWWEMYPTNSVQTVGTTVAPGDAITASVTRSAQNYTLSVTDATHTANSFSTTQACASGCNDTSVEWIAERPSFSIGTAPLVNEHTWALTGGTQQETGSTSPHPISTGPNPTAVTMIDATQSYALSTPSSLSASGKNFTDIWHNSW